MCFRNQRRPGLYSIKDDNTAEYHQAAQIDRVDEYNIHKPTRTKNRPAPILT